MLECNKKFWHPFNRTTSTWAFFKLNDSSISIYLVKFQKM